MQLRKGEKGFTTAVRQLRQYEKSAKEYEQAYRDWKAQPADAPGRRDYMSSPQFHLSVERYFGRTITDLLKDEDFVLFRCDDCGGLGILASDDQERSKEAEKEADPTGTDLSHRHDWGRRGNVYPDGGEVFMLGHNGDAESTRYIGGDDEYETTIDPRASIDICLWCEESQREHSTTVLGIDKEGLAFGVAVGDKTMSATQDNRTLTVGDQELDPWDVARSIGRLLGWKSLGGWRGHTTAPRDVKVDHDGEWVQVVDTWACPMGNGGDLATRHAVPLEELFQKQKEEGSSIPCVWVISPTSNLFSVGVDLYVMKKDESAMLAVLRGEGAEDSVLVESDGVRGV